MNYHLDHTRFDTTEVIKAVKAFVDRHGRGATAEMARLTGIPHQTIKNICDGKVISIKPETWDGLYGGLGPDLIPIPPWHPDYITKIIKDSEKNIVSTQSILLPVFDITVGDPRFIEGKYVGNILSKQPVPRDIISFNSFCVLIPDDSLSPRLERDALAVIDPAAELIDNDICFAVLEEGPKLRRYREVKGNIFLDTLKDDEPFVFNSKDERPTLLKVTWTFKKV